MAISSGMSSGISSDWIGNSLGQAASTREASLKSAMAAVANDPSAANAATMQHEFQMWSILMTATTTASKVYTDAIKEAIQSAR